MGNKGLRFAFRDGFKNVVRHPLILLASISTMVLMLILLGAFMLFSLNSAHLLKQAGERPPVEIQFEVGADENLVRTLDQKLSENVLIVEHKLMSPAENMEFFKERMGKDEFFDDFDYRAHIPWTILLRLSDPALGASFKDEIMKYPGVYDVMMETSLMNLLQDANQKVSIISAVLFPFFCLITVLIMSNMVRMIALARATEISIMKTMGATDRYIRIPFIVEGLFVALVSTFMTLLILFLGYQALTGRMQGGAGALHFLPLSRLLLPLTLILLLVSVIVATLTSVLSVRRYVQV
ncbi:MAG: permease-like cell division protein FtsX [Clostridiales bacterium]|nr:permease-like cell division protein FtsX [Clostridiales bacterium]MDD7432836.1 permease-like cell division protein FtsX [Clostridiales bacterium]MDY3061504.1 permease-like cell division protein FtsX [Eubacteriales bacterium]